MQTIALKQSALLAARALTLCPTVVTPAAVPYAVCDEMPKGNQNDCANQCPDDGNTKNINIANS